MLNWLRILIDALRSALWMEASAISTGKTVSLATTNPAENGSMRSSPGGLGNIGRARPFPLLAAIGASTSVPECGDVDQ